MALDLGDLNDFFDPDATFTVKGKLYRVPAVSAALGLWGRKVAALREAVADDATPQEKLAALQAAEAEIGEPPLPEGMTMQEALLSRELLAELAADGVPDPAIEHLTETVYGRIVYGDKFAKAIFQGEFGPKATPANRQERRAVKKAAPRKAASASPTTSTAKAATTRKPASGSGTKSLPAKAAKAAPASRGRRS